MICLGANPILTPESHHGQHRSSHHPPSRQGSPQTSQRTRQARFSNGTSLFPTQNGVRSLVEPSNVCNRIIKGPSPPEKRPQAERINKIKRQGGSSQHPQKHRQRLRHRISSRCTQGRRYSRKNPRRSSHSRRDQGLGKSATSRQKQECDAARQLSHSPRS